MNIYNKIMRFFWLFAAISLTLIITYLSISEGLNKWGYYYVFVIVSFGMFLFKSYMMKRMERHLKFLEEQKQNTKTNDKR
jgi:hypothetical protein